MSDPETTAECEACVIMFPYILAKTKGAIGDRPYHAGVKDHTWLETHDRVRDLLTQLSHLRGDLTEAVRHLAYVTAANRSSGDLTYARAWLYEHPELFSRRPSAPPPKEG